MLHRRLFLCLFSLFAAALIVLPAAFADGGGATFDNTLYAQMPAGGPAPPSGGYSFCKSSCGGRYQWFDLQNQSAKLTWPSNLNPNDQRINASTGSGLSLILGAEACGESPSVYPAPVKAAAAKVEKTFGITPNGKNCVLWQNYGPDKVKVYSDFGSTISIPGWDVNTSSPPWGEFHNADPHNPSGNQANPTQTIAWNVRIWRQGQSSSFFDRRVGLNVSANGQDDDNGSTDQLTWWRGGTTKNDLGANGSGGLFSNGNLKAGALGVENKADRQRCAGRLGNAPEYFNYTVDGKSVKVENTAAFEFSGKKATRKTLPTNANEYACYWETSSAGYPEAIWIDYSLYNTFGYGRVHYTIIGKPGQMYALLLNGISNREALLLPKGSEGIATSPYERYGNLFQVAVPVPAPPTNCNPLTDPNGCCPPKDSSCDGGPPPSTPTENLGEPQLAVSVTADSSVPVRTQSLVNVSTSAVSASSSTTNTDLADTEAVFPRQVRLLHFTPQLSFDGSNTSYSYPDAYVRYDSDAKNPDGTGERVPTPWMKGPVGGPQKEALLPQPAVPSPDTGTLSSNDYRMTWLKPTIENPCPAWGWSRSTTNPWPYRPDACAVDSAHPVDGQHTNVAPSKLPRNAWSDAVTATVLYESRWVSSRPQEADSGPPWTKQYQSDVSLRCNGDGPQLEKVIAVDSSACDPVFPLTYFVYQRPSSESGSINGTQWAEGYIPLEAGPKRTVGTMGFRLLTTNPSKVVDSVVFHRSSNPGDPWAAGDNLDRQSPLINTKTGQPELWYCKPGLPAGANLVTGASAYKTGAPTKVPVAQENDQACAGYTVKWNWDWATTMAPIQADGSQDPQATNCNTLLTAAPGRKSWPVPTFDALQQYDPSGAGYAQNVGQYSMYDGSNPVAGDPNWTTLLSAGGYQWTIPYNGDRPGNPSADGSAYAPGDCYRVIADGRQQPKHAGATGTGVAGWVKTDESTHYWYKDYDTQNTLTADTEAGLPPSDCDPGTIKKIAHTSSTIKTVKGKKKTVSSTTYTWQCTQTVHHHDPQPVKDPVYTFEWTSSGDCHPQTSAQAQVLTQALKNKLVADDGVLYVTQSDVKSTFDSGENTLKSASDVNYNDEKAKHPVFNTSWSDGLGGCSSAHIPGYITKGGWKLDRAHKLQVLDQNNGSVRGTYTTVGDGWGVNQSGPRQAPGEYQVKFTFGNLSVGDLAGTPSLLGHTCGSGICWALQSDYDGYAGWKWSSVTHFTAPWQPQDTRYIDVFGFRATR